MSQKVEGRTDQRVERSKQAVLSETYKLLWEAGLGGVSVDEVSRRSGVSKTTIYRHWPSRSALLLEACSKLSPKSAVPDTGSLKGDLTVLLQQLADQLQNARWPAVLPSILDAAERDPDLAKLHGELQREMNAPFLRVVAAAQKRGDLSKKLVAGDVVASLVAPLFFRRWHSREKITPAFATQIIDAVLQSATVPEKRRR